MSQSHAGPLPSQSAFGSRGRPSIPSTTASIVDGALPSSQLFTNKNAGCHCRIDRSAIYRIASLEVSSGSWTSL